MTTLAFDPMIGLRQAAYDEMMAYFNEQASVSPHIEIAMALAIARGAQLVHPIEARDARLQETARALIAAETPADIDLALLNMRAPYGSTGNPDSLVTGLMSNAPVVAS